MNDKYYGFTSSLLMGIVLIVMSIIMLIGKGRFYLASVDFIIFIFFMRFILDMGGLFFKRNHSKEKRKIIITSGVFHFGTCLFFLIVPNLFYGLVPILFSVYLVIIGVSQLVMCWLEVRNSEFIRFSHFVIIVACLLVALPIFIDPIMKLDRFVVCVAVYMLGLGLYYIYDCIVMVIPMKTKKRLKRRIRITLPKIVEAIIPYSVMVEINRNLSVRDVSSYSFEKTNKISDLHIMIHTSNRGFNRMGHMDIYFEGKVISYGNYDEGSRFGYELFGDGILFMAKNRADYINFCIDNSKKTIFDFGIVLTDEQKRQVKRRISDLCFNTVKWDHRTDKKYNNGDSYAGRLYKRTRAQFYKFKKGKYRTYYVLGSNCCHFIDDILGKSGMDILSMNGIVTPGTYYDYLNRELKQKNSNVISKDVYNANYKVKGRKK